MPHMTKKSEIKTTPIMPSQMVLPTVDMEYLFRFEGTLAGLEKGLHNDDDPEEIAMQTIEVARDFYDADWCGLISGDLDAGVFYPYWWANRAVGRMAQTKFDEFEFLNDYDTWMHALLHGENVVLSGLSQRKEGVTGSEFRHYQKMDVQSVIGVPLFYHKPCGFMIVKNPKQYADQPTMLAILGYVVLNCWKEQQNLEALKLQMKQPCAELKTERDVFVRLFGEPEIHTLKGQLSAQTLNSPKGWRLLSYLVLRKKPVPIRIIADALSNDEELDRAQNALRVVMSRMKPKLESILDPKESLITNSTYGYRINEHYNLISDLEEFERHIANAKAQVDICPRIDEYKRAIKLYRGPVYSEASHEHWLLPTAEHYAIEYLFAVNHLLKDLAELKDYQSVQHFAAKALEIEPGNTEAVYWMIFALIKIGSVQSAQAEYDRAKQMLPEPAYKELNVKLAEEKIHLK